MPSLGVVTHAVQSLTRYFLIYDHKLIIIYVGGLIERCLGGAMESKSRTDRYCKCKKCRDIALDDFSKEMRRVQESMKRTDMYYYIALSLIAAFTVFGMLQLISL